MRRLIASHFANLVSHEDAVWSYPKKEAGIVGAESPGDVVVSGGCILYGIFSVESPCHNSSSMQLARLWKIHAWISE